MKLLSLKPFNNPTPSLTLKAGVEFLKHGLRLAFELDAPKDLVMNTLQPAVGEMGRADELWRTTCFELFWGEVGEKAYWEFNVSPETRRWNVYRFLSERYPQPPAPDQAYEIEKLVVSEKRLECHLQGPFVRKPEVSLCAVIRTPDTVHYFALNHARPKADFHARESFRPVT